MKRSKRDDREDAAALIRNGLTSDETGLGRTVLLLTELGADPADIASLLATAAEARGAFKAALCVLAEEDA